MRERERSFLDEGDSTMYAVIYEVTQEAKIRWSRSNCQALRDCVAPAQCGEFLGLYYQLECLDILKFLNQDVALWLDYDLIPLDIAVGEVE